MNTPFQSEVAIHTWAGLVWHRVEIIERGHRTTLVRWLDDNPNGVKGSESLIPAGAIRWFPEPENVQVQAA